MISSTDVFVLVVFKQLFVVDISYLVASRNPLSPKHIHGRITLYREKGKERERERER